MMVSWAMTVSVLAFLRNRHGSIHAVDDRNISQIEVMAVGEWNAAGRDISESLGVSTLHFPGVSGVHSIKFFAKNPGNLAARTFTKDIFTCPPNGHEGSITNLYGQLLLTKPNQSEGVVDIGANLGFYSLLPASLGYRTASFDISPSCLHMLTELADRNGVASLVKAYNIGLSDKEETGTNHDEKCDYENFYVEKPTSGKGPKGGETFEIERYDDVAARSDWPFREGVVRLLKIDTEGAEFRILQGMRHELQSGRIKNMIIEVTPAHWFRFGNARMNDTDGVNIFVDLVEKYGYHAYVLYLPPNRRPPPEFSTFVEQLTSHPILTDVADTGCDHAPFYVVKNMRKFMTTYCIDHLANVKRGGLAGESSSSGFCGNLWFHLPA